MENRSFPMTKSRPLSITILAIIVGISALLATIDAFLYLRYLSNSIKPTQISYYALLGFINWAVMAVVFGGLVYGLWKMKIDSTYLVAGFAGLAILIALVQVYATKSWVYVVPTIVINAIIAVYCLVPGVKRAVEPEPEPVPFPVDEQEFVEEEPDAGLAQAAVVAAAVSPLLDEPEEDVIEEPLAETPLEEEPEIGGAAAAAALAGASALEDEDQEDAVPVPVEAPAAEPAAPAAHAPRKVPIETIEGIGTVYGEKLMAIGIVYVSDLLAAGASRKGREELVQKTGISSALILRWVNMADLMRISGIGEEYSELLEAAGVDTVKELRNRVPEHLYQAMLEANQRRKLVRRTPYLSEVQSWVEQAKKLDPVMTY
jgi:predicted flap endonuclease-1-like 5' DNA nuclease